MSAPIAEPMQTLPAGIRNRRSPARCGSGRPDGHPATRVRGVAAAPSAPPGRMAAAMDLP